MRHGAPSQSGFTLIELMLVITIMGILSSLAIPKFADLSRRAKEAATKGNLASIRTAVTFFYAENGRYPQMIEDDLTVNGKYLSRIPPLTIPIYHPAETTDIIYFAMVPPVDLPFPGWGYVPMGMMTDPPVTPVSGYIGTVFVPCTHLDVRGMAWNRN